MSPTQVDREPLLHTCEFYCTKRKILLTFTIDGNPDIFGRDNYHHNNGDTIFNTYERDGK